MNVVILTMKIDFCYAKIIMVLSALFCYCRTRFPEYWDEMCGTADGSEVPFLQVMLCVLPIWFYWHFSFSFWYWVFQLVHTLCLPSFVSYAFLRDFGTSFLLKPGEGDIGALQVLLINMRKEIAPFLPTKTSSEKLGDADQCSTVLLHSDNLSLIAHNEDAHVSILDHVYILSLSLSPPLSSFVT